MLVKSSKNASKKFIFSKAAGLQSAAFFKHAGEHELFHVHS